MDLGERKTCGGVGAAAMTAEAAAEDWSDQELGFGEGVFGLPILPRTGLVSFSVSRERDFFSFPDRAQSHGPIPTEGSSSIMIYPDQWFDCIG
jgi:hypothetical protein